MAIIEKAPASQQIAGIPVHPVGLQQVVDAIVDRSLSNDPGAYICLANAFSSALSDQSVAFKGALDDAFLAVPDGMPMVWVLRRRGHLAAEKVTGRELIPLTIAAGAEHGLRHLLYGGAPGVAETAAAELVRRIPGALVDAAPAPFSTVEEWPIDELGRLVHERKPHVLWVGIGAPKQEILMARVAGKLEIPVQVGVGAAFDFIAGAKREVPKMVSDLGLEWAFRLLTEPKRLWKRYLLGNTKFLYLLGREALK